MPLPLKIVGAILFFMASCVVVQPHDICDRVQLVKMIPFDGKSGVDANYDALIAAGKTAVPCLIRRVTDTRRMDDPRMDPGYGGITYRVGDTAFFIVWEIMGFDILKILPASYHRVLKESGNYAYFKYVQRARNRERVRDRLRMWYRNVYVPSLRKSAV